MYWRLATLLIPLLFCAQPAQTAPVASPAINRALQPFLDGQEVSGAVTLVARDGQRVHLAAQGLADVATGRPMRTDDLFWIASMTKPIAAVAVLVLQDEGRLSVDDPVDRHLPEFTDAWQVAERSDQTLVLKRPPRKITLRDLLTHTAGVPNLAEPRPHTTLGELVAQVSQRPLSFDPGSRWSYSNAGIDTLGRVVEVVSGQAFADFLEERLFTPLGMHDTTFFPSRSQARRVAKSYEKQDGQLAETEVFFVKGDLWDRQRTVKPAGGLYSTAEDMFRFYQMMLQGGIYEGRRFLSESAVRQMTRTQTGELETGFSPGMSWGLGFQVVRQPQGVTAMLAPGTFGHGGAYATQSWADPQQTLIYILMVQRRGFPNGDQSPIREAFQQAASEAFAR